MRRIHPIIWIILLAVALVPLSHVQANSAPPPGEIWFFIQYPQGGPARLAAAQLLGCADLACAQPVVIQQWGVCSATGCLTPAAAVTNAPGDFLECANEVCHSRQFRYSQPYFKLAVQLGDRLYVDPVTHELPDSYGEKFYWTAAVSEAGLTLTPAEGLPDVSLPIPPFFAFFGLTLFVEMLVVGIFSKLRWKLDATGMVVQLLLVAVINLLTYPVVWGFFPELLRFGSPGIRSFGWLLAGYLLVLGVIMALAINANNRRLRVVWIILGALLLVAGGFCVLLGLLAAGYSSPAPALTGLPVWLVLLMAEAYAVVVETLMLYFFTRREVDLRLSFLLSLGMNAASFLIGLLLAAVI